MMKKKGKLWLVEQDKPKLKISPLYGWGWHIDPEGRMVMLNPTVRWMKTRMEFYLRKGSTWWDVGSIQNSLTREYRVQFAHKKKAVYDIKKGAYVYEEKGKTYTI